MVYSKQLCSPPCRGSGDGADRYIYHRPCGADSELGAVNVGADAVRVRVLRVRVLRRRVLRRRGRLVGGGRSAGGRLVSPSATVMGCGGRRGRHARARRHA